jgi:ADP-heptose:LPS heptosyltransferase/GT2 family glycosyltransferase
MDQVAAIDQEFANTTTAKPFLIEVEHPAAGSVINSGPTIAGHGWLLAPSAVLAVSVGLHDAALCQAVIGLARMDVAQAHPDYPGSGSAGFVFSAELPEGRSGPAELCFHVRTARGTHVHRVGIILRNGSQSASAGLDPLRLNVEEAKVDAAGRLHVHGWAVALQPIRSVEILLGQRALGRAQTLLPRADVGRALGAYPDAGSAGFQFDCRLDLPEAATKGAIAVVATGADGETRQATVPVDLPSRLTASGKALPPPMLARIEEAAVSERGILRVRGWALSLSAIDRIDVYLGDCLLGIAEASISRDDVRAAHPEYPNGGAPGFLLQREMPQDAVAAAGVRVVVSAVGGIRRELTAPVVLPPVVKRQQTAEMVHVFVDSVSLRTDGRLTGDGWAVCPSGVESITLAIEGHEPCQVQIGRDRPDVGNRFPANPHARKAGFSFDAVLPGRFEGEYVVEFLVRGHSGDAHSVLQPVAAIEGEPAASTPAGKTADTDAIKFYLDTPVIKDSQGVEPVRGFMVLNGWAFARAGMASIEVFVDGQSQGNAYYGIRREEVQAAFPDRDALLSGFAMLIPPQVMKRGRHDVQIVLRDRAGHVEEAAFSVDAEPMAEGPGPWQLRRKMPQSEIALQNAILASAGVRTTWTLLLPLASTAPLALARARKTLRSLRHQAYPEWRLHVILPDDIDTDGAAEALLSDLDELAPHINVTKCGRDTPLACLAGEQGLLAVLSPGDRLGEDALLEITTEAAVRSANGATPDFLYSDERRIDPADGEQKAFWKPDWSPDLLLSTNYIGRLWAATPALLRRAGILLGDLAERGDYDTVLRLTEQAERIQHVPRVLCARGGRQGDTAARERDALRSAAHRRGIAADVLPGCVAGTWRLKRHVTTAGMVSIIMPTIASRGLVRTTIESIRAKTAWPNYEIIVLDNIPPSNDQEKCFWKGWLRDNADLVIEIREGFNWSRFNNIGAAQARGEFLLFLNDDIEILDEAWLHALLEHAQQSEIGVVGPQLLYPDGSVQHAGIFLSRTVGRHAFRFYPRHAPGPFGLALTQRNVISVTGACMLMRREVFDEVGGFDEKHAVINNDLDFCLRLGRSGKRVVYTPHATMVHHEMVSRSKLADVYNSAHFDAVWKDLFLQGDPYFHPLLTSDYDDYLNEPEPLRQFQAGHPLIARDAVRRILAVKLDHIGDFIAAFPAFRRIKSHFPNAELVVLAAKASLSLAELEPAIDRVIEFNFFHARSESGRRVLTREELRTLHRTLAPQRFDIALDLRRQTDTREILRHTGARWLAGFDQDYACRWLDIAVEFEGDVSRQFKRSHVSDSLVHFIDTISVACESDRAGVRSPMAKAQARQIVAGLPAAREYVVRDTGPGLFDRPVVCVHAGAGAVNKQWPAASFADLIDLLVGRAGAHVVIIGGPDEAAIADQVLSQIRRSEQVFSLIGKTSLRDLPTLLLSCDLYVGNDSGPKHMAASLGVPTIGIHSGSVDAGEWGPMGTNTVTIRRDMTCGPCYIALAADCPRSLACLHGIAVGDVYRACERMLLLRQGHVD